MFSAPALILSSAYADVTENVDFVVNVAETLTLTVTDPTNWAEGQLINTNPTTGRKESNFLRNKVNVKAKTNNPIGVTVSMYTKGDTDLRNTTSYNASDATTYLPTLSGAEAGITVANFPTNKWGYSVNDDGSSTSANYYALSTNPIQLFTTTSSAPNYDATGVEDDQDVYFGAKADETMASGTYIRTVYFAAVTGTVDTNTNPLKPTNPSETDPINNASHYSSVTGNTTYTQRSTSGSGTDSVTGSMDSTQTDVTKGDISTTYAQAYGVTSESNGSALATAFAVSAGVAATSGIFFFVAAKRRKDDDEDEEGK